MNLLDTTVLVVLGCGCVLMFRKPVVQGLHLARDGWRANPAQMTSKLVLGFVLGQGIFWFLGYDQLGLFMSPFKEFGLGRPIGEAVAGWLPQTVAVGWTLKIIEILTDAARIPLEGALYRRHGFVPDVVATLVTQPLWTCLEVAEKVTGAIVRAELIGTPGQIYLSAAAIYGNLFRYILDVVYLKKGDAIYRWLGQPMEDGLRRLFRRRKR